MLVKHPVKFYANTWIFGKVPLRDVIRRISDIGFDGIELIGDIDSVEIPELMSIVNDLGIQVISICGLYLDKERILSHPDTKQRQKAIDYVRSCIDLAKTVGAQIIVIVPSQIGVPKPIISREKDMWAATDSLNKVAEYAGRMNVLLTIEPINKLQAGLINNIEDAIKLATQVDNNTCRIMADTFHMQIEEPDGIPNAIRRAGNYWLQHIHVSDNTHEAPGMGTLPWRDIIRALQDIEYSGGISFESLSWDRLSHCGIDGHTHVSGIDAELCFGLSYLKATQDSVMQLHYPA